LVYPPIIVTNIMKVVISAALLILIIGNIAAVDIGSHQFIDHIRAITEPRRPEIFENGVLFTASSAHRRVGISFAHEGYARVHWFRQLMIPRDSADFLVGGRGTPRIDPNIDTGIMFHIEPIPYNIRNMDYRLIIDGLWTTDHLNPHSVIGPSGIVESRVNLPERPRTSIEAAQPGTFRFSFRAAPGEIITVGGSFNNWDPFMYELRETSPGLYTLTLPLSPGRFQYVFFHRGEQVTDPGNPVRLFTREGNTVSEAIVH
jgi:hypothetical protein